MWLHKDDLPDPPEIDKSTLSAMMTYEKVGKLKKFAMQARGTARIDPLRAWRMLLRVSWCVQASDSGRVGGRMQSRHGRDVSREFVGSLLHIT